MDLGAIIPAMLMPGIIGTSTDKAITAEPTNVSLRSWAALGLQKIIGAKKSHRPTKVVAHCAHQAVRLESDRVPNSAMRSPLTRSLIVSADTRHSTLGRPRSTVTARTALLTFAVVIAS